MSKKYNDIIHLPHYVSKSHPKMAALDRAAQFSPFSALSGYEAAIKEAARLTSERAELDESMKDTLSDKLQVIAEKMKEEPEIAITYFKPDTKKKGGSYLTARGFVKKIDEYNRAVVMTDGKIIPIDEIFGIDGEIFENLMDYSFDE
jgi:hypothetical protein